MLPQKPVNVENIREGPLICSIQSIEWTVSENDISGLSMTVLEVPKYNNGGPFY